MTSTVYLTLATCQPSVESGLNFLSISLFYSERDERYKSEKQLLGAALKTQRRPGGSYYEL